MSVSPSTQKRSKPAPEPMEAIDGGTPPASRPQFSHAFAQREDGGAAGGDDFAGGVVERIHLGQPMTVREGASQA